MDTWSSVELMLRSRYGVRIIEKKDSTLHQILGWLLFWTWRFSWKQKKFTRTYMTRYTTVLFKTIALPSTRPSVSTLLHEAQHIDDFIKYPWLQAAYLLPQLLVPVAVGLALGVAWWWWAVAVILLLAPSPARAWIERRGYTVTLACAIAQGRVIDEDYFDWLVSQFTSPTYLFMWPFPGQVRAYFKELAADMSAPARTRFLPPWAEEAFAIFERDSPASFA